MLIGICVVFLIPCFYALKLEVSVGAYKCKNCGHEIVANGDNLGVALRHADRDFPDSEIIGDLTIYADMNGFDDNLKQIANDYLDESVRKMEKISNILNSVGILLVSAIIAWVVLGTFQMQDQITSAIS